VGEPRFLRVIAVITNRRLTLHHTLSASNGFRSWCSDIGVSHAGDFSGSWVPSDHVGYVIEVDFVWAKERVAKGGFTLWALSPMVSKMMLCPFEMYILP
jgi:hypothetical protein